MHLSNESIIRNIKIMKQFEYKLKINVTLILFYFCMIKNLNIEVIVNIELIINVKRTFYWFKNYLINYV